MVNHFHQARYFFLLFSAMGIVSPYLGWWLQQTSAPSYASIVLACFYATLILTPSLWGYAAFSNNRPGHWLAHGTLFASVFALGLTQIHSGTPIVASCFLMISFGIFYNPLMSLLDAIAYSQVNDPHIYSRIRLYGSLGFLIFSSIVGGTVVLSKPQTFPFFVSLMMFIAYLASLPYKKTYVVAPVDSSGILKALPRLLWDLKSLWLIVVASQIAFVMYYTYVALYLSFLGYSNLTIGLLIGVATLAEIAAFWKIRWFFKRQGPWNLIAIASLVTVGRWLVFAEANYSLVFLILILIAQLGHALSFAVFHTSCLKIINEKSKKYDMGLMQGVYNALGYGIGGVIGVLLGACLWKESHALVFTVAAIVSLLASGFAYWRGRQSSLTPPIEA